MVSKIQIIPWCSIIHTRLFDFRVMQGGVNFFGRIYILIDQNTQAFHMFMSALLQLFDRTGVLYGELARFVLRLLGIKIKPRKINQSGPGGFPGPHNPHGNQNHIEAAKAAPSAAWDNVWGEKGSSYFNHRFPSNDCRV
ncbi:peroxisomal membrane protein 13-like [Hibiscus syriacus]|uniref:peroxisomal membrane protein 13-like n=1 Tax=Hibiscus syriacus TaxID=106335 RepID=UPI001922E395|nr:peroxisomal membrane protein 13-like [Hibiscus syriacus]